MSLRSARHLARRSLAAGLALLAATGAALAQAPGLGDGDSGNAGDAEVRAVATLDVQGRPSPFATEAVHVGPHDVQPSESNITASTANGEPYAYLRGVRGKSGLELQGAAIDSGGTFCFGTGLDLPDGARIVALAAVLADPDGPDERADAAETFLQARPWTETRADTLAAVAAPGGGYEQAVATGDGLPATVDRSANEIRLIACLRGDGGFLGARVTYLRP
jgi:hypothetical protein